MCSGVTQTIDDEYKWAGVEDPKIMITTARDPSAKLKQFAKVSHALLVSYINTLVSSPNTVLLYEICFVLLIT